MHKTSLNISSKMNTRLNEASEQFKISKRMLVAKIFKLCHRNLDFNILVTGELTGYQKKSPGDKWKCLRVDFSDTECDVYVEYRKMFRISLSKLLAVGFFLFFDQIINELNNNSMNEKVEVAEILNTYTDIKRLLYNSIKDALKFFILPEKTEQT